MSAKLLFVFGTLVYVATVVATTALAEEDEEVGLLARYVKKDSGGLAPSSDMVEKKEHTDINIYFAHPTAFSVFFPKETTIKSVQEHVRSLLAQNNFDLYQQFDNPHPCKGCLLERNFTLAEQPIPMKADPPDGNVVLGMFAPFDNPHASGIKVTVDAEFGFFGKIDGFRFALNDLGAAVYKVAHKEMLNADSVQTFRDAGPHSSGPALPLNSTLEELGFVDEAFVTVLIASD